MILNNIDIGGRHPWQRPQVGQVLGTVPVEGIETTVYPRGAMVQAQTVGVWVRAWQGIGGAAALTSAALLYLLKQVEELASNRDMQPVFIQWAATAEGGALNQTNAHDGWYVITDFEPDYSQYAMGPEVLCRLSVARVAPGPPRSVAMSYSGGPLTSDFSGTPYHWIPLPGPATFATSSPTTALEHSINRKVAEQGSVACLPAPTANPERFVLPGTISDCFRNDVKVFDTIDTGSNPIPGNGNFQHANWVQVFDPQHNFIGDCVITNGLILLIEVASSGLSAYFWDTTVATPNWVGGPGLLGVSANYGSMSYKLIRVGPEEAALQLVGSDSNNIEEEVVRLGRGRYDIRFDYRSLTRVTTEFYRLRASYFVDPKVAFNSTKLADRALTETMPTCPTDFGYGAYIFAPAQGITSHAVHILLAQNRTGDKLPEAGGGYMGLGDTVSQPITAWRSYGFAMVPYGVNGQYSTANLLAEAESGTLGTGWTSQAGAGGNSNSLEAKCASGTVAGNADTFGTAFVPEGGYYDVWFRVKVTSAAGAALEMQLGLWNSTDSVFVASTTYRANQVTTAYAWYRAATVVLPTAGKNMRFRAVTALTLGTDWFIDEAAMVPRSAPFGLGNLGFPQDIWQQWMYDRSVRMIRN